MLKLSISFLQYYNHGYNVKTKNKYESLQKILGTFELLSNLIKIRSFDPPLRSLLKVMI